MLIYIVFKMDFAKTLFLGAFDSEDKAQSRIESHIRNTGNEKKYYFITTNELNKEVLDVI